MIVDHLMLARVICNHEKIHINRKRFSRAMLRCQNIQEKNPFHEGEINFTMSRCASKISFV